VISHAMVEKKGTAFMPLLIILFALFVPRLVILGLYFMTHWFDGIFKTLLFPLLGFIFMPVTLLWYTAVHNWFNGQWDVLQLAGLVVAIIIDIAPARMRRRRVVREVVVEE
jgi:hypothetical protein